MEDCFCCPICLKKNVEKKNDFIFCKCLFFFKTNMLLKDFENSIQTKIDINHNQFDRKLSFDVMGIGRCK